MNHPMKGELKPGGLALIIFSKNNKENIGKVVTLDRLLSTSESYEIEGHGSFQNASGGTVWLVRGPVFNTFGIYGFTQAAPRNLMPLDDDGTIQSEQEGIGQDRKISV